jgi:hypothetical protein
MLKQSSLPTPSASLQVWLGKAKSSDVAQSIPPCSPFPGLMLLCDGDFGNAYQQKEMFVFFENFGL